MSRYSVSGTLSPDATTLDTGAAAGTHEGQDYWTWTNDAGTWYLWGRLVGGTWRWVISAGLGDQTSSFFKTQLTPVAGEYEPQGGATGTATVTELADEYYAIEWTASGKFTVLKKGS